MGARNIAQGTQSAPPTCPVYGKATFLPYDREHYSDYRCCDKKCNHSLFVPKPTAIQTPSMSKLFGKADFKRMRYLIHVILMNLTMLYLGKIRSETLLYSSLRR